MKIGNMKIMMMVLLMMIEIGKKNQDVKNFIEFLVWMN